MRSVIGVQFCGRRLPREHIGGDLQLHAGDQGSAHLRIVARQVDFKAALHDEFLVDHVLEDLVALCVGGLSERHGELRLRLGHEVAAQDGTLIDQRDGFRAARRGARALGGEQTIARDRPIP